MVDVQGLLGAHTRVQRRDVAVKLEAPALPSHRSADGLDDAELDACLQVCVRGEAPLDHDRHCGCGMRAGKLAELLNLLAGNAAEKAEHVNQIGGGGAWLFEVDDVAVFEENGEPFLARRDTQDAALAAERQHFERGLQPKRLEVAIENPPLWLHLPPLVTPATA